MSFQENISRWRSSQLYRYLFIGGVSYTIELTALLLLASQLNFAATTSVSCSFFIGLIVSFLLQKYIAFGDKKSDKKTIGKQTVAYVALILFNYAFTVLFVLLFTNTFKNLFDDSLELTVARTIALLLTVTWNYFVYKNIFRKVT